MSPGYNSLQLIVCPQTGLQSHKMKTQTRLLNGLQINQTAQHNESGCEPQIKPHPSSHITSTSNIYKALARLWVCGCLFGRYGDSALACYCRHHVTWTILWTLPAMASGNFKLGRSSEKMLEFSQGTYWKLATWVLYKLWANTSMGIADLEVIFMKYKFFLLTRLSDLIM